MMHTVHTTSTNRLGERVFRTRRVELADRPAERDFIPASADRPAQHRVFEVRREHGLTSLVPLLVIDPHDDPTGLTRGTPAGEYI